MGLTLDYATRIVDTALASGRERRLKPLAVAVLDAGGHLIAFKREDKAGLLRFDIAFAKAYGALGMGFGSREIASRAEGNPTFIAALSVISGGRLAPASGGVLVISAGEVVGAVGISGDTSDNDEACARTGVEALEFEAQIGACEILAEKLSTC